MSAEAHMQEQLETSPETEIPATVRRGRRTLLLLALVALLPVLVAGYLLLTDWRPGGKSVQYGELLNPPRSLPDVQLKDADGQTVQLATLRNHWLLLARAQGSCTQACRKNLWTMQQVRLAQGKDMRRVQRVLILDNPRAINPRQLARDYPGTHVLVGNAAGLRSLRAVLDEPGEASDAGRDRIYLIDPLGNLVLRYAPGADPGGIRRDLARLLRLSQIG
jgi:cytochrome oxidase Cu insertion factor (SCO1/SenC/PrrC family)